MAERPRIFACMPTRGYARLEAAQSHYCLPTRGACEIIPGMSVTTLLAHGFNRLWAMALGWHTAGIVTHWLLHHDDVQVMTPGYLDLMIEEMQSLGTAALSVVQAIKSSERATSTAVDGPSPWAPRRLSLDECLALPPTFSSADLGGPLLVNTGLLLIDLSRPEWWERDPADPRCLAFRWHIEDRIVQAPDGELVPQYRPEDWEFSRWCHARKIPYHATTKIRCHHWGDRAHPNYSPDPSDVTPEMEVPAHAGV